MSLAIYTSLAKLSKQLRALFFLAACCLLIWVSSYQPSGGSDSHLLPFLFQIGHAPLFGVFALSTLLLWGSRGPNSFKAQLLVFLIVAVAGLIDEWHQISVPARASDLQDVVTDLIGGLSAIALARWASGPAPKVKTGLSLLVVILLVLCAWGWISFDSTPWPLPLIN